MIKSIIFLFLLLVWTNMQILQAQSIEINPANADAFISGKGSSSSNQVFGKLSKIGLSKFIIEGKSFTDNEFIYGINGSSQIDLVGDPFGDINSYSSRNGINFKHGTTTRWFMGDNLETDFFSTYEDAFIINHFIPNGPFTKVLTPFKIRAGNEMLVDISNLRIGSDATNFDNGFLIKRGLFSEVILNNQSSSPINFQIFNTTRLTLLPEGNFGIGTANPQRKLDVAGTARISQTLEVNGNSTFSGTATIGGNTSLGQNLNVAGTGTISGNTTLSQNLEVVGSSLFNSSVVVNTQVKANSILIGTGTNVFSTTTKLHIRNGLSGSTTNSSAHLVRIENNDDAFLTFAVPANKKAGIQFLKPGSSPDQQFVGSIRLTENNNFDFRLGENLNRMRLTSDGSLTIGMSVGGSGCLKNGNGTVLAGTCASDSSYKKDIISFEPLLNDFVRLNPVNFNWRVTDFPEKDFGIEQSYGFIAQEVEKIFPELVQTDENGFKAVNYSKLNIMSIQAIKELRAENEELQEQLQLQKRTLNTQESRLVAIENLLGIKN